MKSSEKAEKHGVHESNPTLSAITCSDENFDIDPPTRYTKAL
jgi:hypothetical protein